LDGITEGNLAALSMFSSSAKFNSLALPWQLVTGLLWKTKLSSFLDFNLPHHYLHSILFGHESIFYLSSQTYTAFLPLFVSRVIKPLTWTHDTDHTF
jgi:hypothetical protein